MRRLVALVLFVLIASVASADAARSPLTGVYQVKVTGNGGLNGTWVLSFAPNGAYVVAKQPQAKSLLIGGSSTIAGKTLTMVDKSGPLSCTGSTARGTYSWSLSGKTLKLAKLHDSCGGRPLVLSRSWTKVP